MNTTVIKRYVNRKLYDTSNSTYLTLPELADIIRSEKQTFTGFIKQLQQGH